MLNNRTNISLKKKLALCGVLAVLFSGVFGVVAWQNYQQQELLQSPYGDIFEKPIVSEDLSANKVINQALNQQYGNPSEKQKVIKDNHIINYEDSAAFKEAQNTSSVNSKPELESNNMQAQVSDTAKINNSLLQDNNVSTNFNSSNAKTVKFSVDDSNYGKLNVSELPNVKKFEIGKNGTLKAYNYKDEVTQVKYSRIVKDNKYYNLAAWAIVENGKVKERLVTNESGNMVYSFEGSSENLELCAITSSAKAVLSDDAKILTFSYNTPEDGENVYGLDVDAGYKIDDTHVKKSYAPMYFYNGVLKNINEAKINDNFKDFHPESTALWFGSNLPGEEITYNKFSIVGLDNISTDSLRNASGMFSGWTGQIADEFSFDKWNLSGLQNTFAMFAYSSTANEGLENIKLTRATNLQYCMYTFTNSLNLKSIVFDNCSFENVKDFTRMCEQCTKLTNVEAQNEAATRTMKAPKVESLACMFQNCTALQNFNFENLLNVTSDTPDSQMIYRMFLNCKSLANVDMGGWDNANIGKGTIDTGQTIRYTQEVFTGAQTIHNIWVSKNWDDQNGNCNFDSMGLYTPHATSFGEHWYDDSNGFYVAKDLSAEKSIKTKYKDVPDCVTVTCSPNKAEAGSVIPTSSFQVLKGSKGAINDVNDNKGSIEISFEYKANNTDDNEVLAEKTIHAISKNAGSGISYGFTDFTKNDTTITGEYVFDEDTDIIANFGERSVYSYYPNNANESNDKTFTFYYDCKRHLRNYSGTTFDLNTDRNTPAWVSTDTSKPTAVQGATSARFDSSFKEYKDVTTTYEWFKNFSKLTAIDFGRKEIAPGQIELNLNTSKVEYTEEMFDGCVNLNDGWDDYKYFDMSSNISTKRMFAQNKLMQSYDLSMWNTINNTDLTEMFEDCTALKEVKFHDSESKLHTENVKWFNRVFKNCVNLQTADLSTLDTSKNEYLNDTFYGCKSLKTVNLSGWNFDAMNGNKDRTTGVFGREESGKKKGDTCCLSLETLVINYKNSSYAFNNTNFEILRSLVNYNSPINVKYIDLSYCNTKKVTNMSKLFGSDIDIQEAYSQLQKLEVIDMTNWDTSNVTDMSYMLSRLPSLRKINTREIDLPDNEVDLSGLNTAKCNNMSHFMYGDFCEYGTAREPSVVNMPGYRYTKDGKLMDAVVATAKNCNCEYMFAAWTQSNSGDTFPTTKPTSGKWLFDHNQFVTTYLTAVNAAYWDISNITDFNHAFYRSLSVKTVDFSRGIPGRGYAKDEGKVNKAKLRHMFDGDYYACREIDHINTEGKAIPTAEPFRNMSVEKIYSEEGADWRPYSDYYKDSAGNYGDYTKSYPGWYDPDRHTTGSPGTQDYCIFSYVTKLAGSEGGVTSNADGDWPRQGCWAANDDRQQASDTDRGERKRKVSGEWVTENLKNYKGIFTRRSIKTEYINKKKQDEIETALSYLEMGKDYVLYNGKSKYVSSLYTKSGGTIDIGSTIQKWTVSKTSSNYIRIKNASTGGYLSLKSSAVPKCDTSALYESTSTTGSNWILEYVDQDTSGNPIFRIKAAKDPYLGVCERTNKDVTLWYGNTDDVDLYFKFVKSASNDEPKVTTNDDASDEDINIDNNNEDITSPDKDSDADNQEIHAIDQKKYNENLFEGAFNFFLQAPVIKEACHFIQGFNFSENNNKAEIAGDNKDQKDQFSSKLNSGVDIAYADELDDNNNEAESEENGIGDWYKCEVKTKGFGYNYPTRKSTAFFSINFIDKYKDDDGTDYDFNNFEIVGDGKTPLATETSGLYCIDPGSKAYGRYAFMPALYRVDAKRFDQTTGTLEYDLLVTPIGDKEISVADDGTIDWDGRNIGYQRMKCKLRTKFQGNLEIFKTSDVDKDFKWDVDYTKKDNPHPNYSFTDEDVYYDVYKGTADDVEKGKAPYVSSVKLERNSEGLLYGKLVDLPPGTYSVRESEKEHGKNYLRDETIYTHDLKAFETWTVKSKEDPAINKPATGEGNIGLVKVDQDTGEYKGANFDGAAYDWLYYPQNYTKFSDVPDSRADYKWRMRVKKNGNPEDPASLYYTTSLSDGEEYQLNGDKFFKDRSGKIVFPIGTYVIREAIAPEGYGVSDAVFLMTVVPTYDDKGSVNGVKVNYYDQDGNQLTDIVDGQYAKAKEKQLRGDYEFSKAYYSDAVSATPQPLANIPFKITNKTNGEWHVAVTDQSGVVSTNSDFAAHVDEETCNLDDKLLNDDGSIPTTGIDDDKIIPKTPIWFYGTGEERANPNPALGALPCGDYTVEELPVTANAGFELKTWAFSIRTKGEKASDGIVIDPRCSIETSAKSLEGFKLIEATDSQTIIDKVFYKNLNKGSSYQLNAALYYTDGKPVKDKEGNDYTATASFVPTEPNGETDAIKFVIDARLLQGKDIVVYEELYKTDFGKEIFVTSHKDPLDSKQTVRIKQGKLETELMNSVTGEKVVPLSENVQLKDILSYEGLSKGTTYNATTEIHELNASGEDIGERYSGQSSFTPDADKGTHEVVFSLDTRNVGDGNILVAYETVSLAGTDIVVHKDKDDVDQQVKAYERSLKTYLVKTPGGNKEIPKADSVNLSDSMTYTGLDAGHEYFINTVCKYKKNNTGDEIELYNGWDSKTAEKASGTWNIDFSINSTNMFLNDKAYVYQYVYADWGDEEPVIKEEDPTSEEQSVYVKSSMWSELLQSQDGNSCKVIPRGIVNLEDRIEVNNLNVGSEYKIVTQLWKKNPDDPANPTKFGSSNTQYFIADAVDTNVVVKLNNINTLELQPGDEIVAYDVIYDSFGTTIARHEDINNEKQTLKVTGLTTGLVNTDNGTKIVPKSSTVRLTDTLSYENLMKNSKYDIQTKIINKSTGSVFKEQNSEYSTGEDGFGQFEIVIDNIDTRMLEADSQLVCFEKISFNGTPIAIHEDIDDEEQSVTIQNPNLDTEFLNAVTGDKSLHRAPGQQLIDKVSFSNVAVGQQYRIDSVLYNAYTKMPLSISCSEWFTADAASCTYSSLFNNIDTTKYDAGTRIAAKTSVSIKGIDDSTITLVEHNSNLDIPKQEVTVEGADLKTLLLRSDASASDPTSKVVPRSSESRFTDIIEYNGLVSGYDYKIKSQLVSKKTNRVLSEQTHTRIADSITGTWSVDLICDTSNLDSDDVIYANEEVYINNREKDMSKNKDVLVAKENGKEIQDQQVTLGEEQISTSLVQTDASIEGSKILLRNTDIELVDNVEYKGFKPGEYTVESKLVYLDAFGQYSTITYTDSKEGTEKTTEQTNTVTIDQTSGKYQVKWKLDTTDTQAFRSGMRIVAFEVVKQDDRIIATHQNYYDNNQAVTVTPASVKTHFVSTNGVGKQIPRTDDARLTDHAEYKGLIPGKHYLMEGELYKTINNDKTKLQTYQWYFTPETSDGELALELVPNGTDPIDITNIGDYPAEAGLEIVEYLYEYYPDSQMNSSKVNNASAIPSGNIPEGERGPLITAEEKSPNGEETVYVTNLQTRLLDTTHEYKEIAYEEDASVFDEVYYNGLLDQSKEYTLESKLVYKKDGVIQDFSETQIVTLDLTKYPTHYIVPFNISSEELISKGLQPGDIITAYEYIKDSNGILFAQHEDFGNVEQSIKIKVEEIVRTDLLYQTDASDKKIVPKASNVDLNDEIQIKRFNDPSKTYTVKSRLAYRDITKSLDSKGSFDPTSASIDQISYLTDWMSREVTAEEINNGKIVVKFENIDFSNVPNGTRVSALEEIYVGEKDVYDPDKTRICYHNDMSDYAQTVTVDNMKTNLVTVNGHSKYLTRGNNNIVDRIEYGALNDQSTYTAVVRLMRENTDISYEDPAQKETPVLDKNGKPVLCEKTLKPAEGGKGVLDVDFYVDTSDRTQFPTGTKIVAYDEIYDESKNLISNHWDFYSPEQTLTIVENLSSSFTTTSSGAKVLPRLDNASAVDQIKGDCFVADASYYVKPEIKYKDPDTGEFISVGDYDEQEYRATGATGTITYEFTIDASSSIPENVKEIVAFQTLKDANHNVVAAHEDMTSETQRLYLGELNTTLVNSEDNTKFVPHKKDVKLTDTLNYTNLEPYKTYVAEGSIIRYNTDASMAVSSQKFTTGENGTGYITLNYTVDTTSLERDEELVAYASVKQNGDEFIYHRDKEDAAQKVSVTNDATLDTELLDASTHSHKVLCDLEAKLTDSIIYTGLAIGKEYRLESMLYKVTEDASELILTKDASFEASSSGKASVDLTVDTTSMEPGTKIVAFETVYDAQDEVVKHCDIEDADQTVTLERSKLDTLLLSANEDASKEIERDTNAKMTDTISYEGLYVGQEYKLRTKLVNFDQSSEVLLEQTETFKPNTSTGIHSIDLSLDTHNKDHIKKIVCFEYVYSGKSLIMAHEDINDWNQSLVLKESADRKLETDLLDTASGKQLIPRSSDVRLTDTLTYEGLNVGDSYKVKTKLIRNKDKSEYFIPDDCSFSVTSSSGKFSVPIGTQAKPLDTRDLVSGETLTAYEYVYRVQEGYPDRLILSHDKELDPRQTVSVLNNSLKTKFMKAGTDDTKVVPKLEHLDLTDVMTYEGLSPNEVYAVETELKYIDEFDQSHDLPFETTSATEFSPGSSGTENFKLNMWINSSKLKEGTKVVAFETIKLKNGGQVIAAEKDIHESTQTITVKEGTLITELLTSPDGKHVIPHSASNTLIDTASYDSLETGHTYRLEGSIMREDTMQSIKDASSEFVTTAPQGDIKLEFNGINTSNLPAGTKLVAFETIYDGLSPIMSHKDYKDEAQTVTVINDSKLETKLLETDTGSKEILRLPSVKLKDTLSYSGLAVGVKYKLVSKLINKADESVVAEKTKKDFIPDATGTFSVDFDISTLDMAPNTEIVAYEYVYFDDVEVVKHDIKTDANQTVKVIGSSLATKLLESETGSKSVLRIPDVKLTDTIDYTNLSTSQTYTLKSRLVTEDGKDFVPEQTKDFKPSSLSGQESVDFVADTTRLEKGAKVIAFESVYLGSTLIEAHERLGDEDQTVVVEGVSLKTVLVNAVDGGHEVVKGTDVSLKDTISYTGLDIGREYILKSKLVTDDGSEFANVEGTFVADESGQATVDFKIDTSTLPGDSKLVCYEYVYCKDAQSGEETQIGKHENINDKDQTVYLKDSPIPPSFVTQTGNIVWLFVIVLGISAVICAYIVGRKWINNSKHKHIKK